MLPPPVLREVQQELLDYQGTGVSIMEQSHRGPDYERVHNEAIELFRNLLSIPNGYRVLFMQGGAQSQFALVPLNLLREGTTADYIVTGHWAERALAEAATLGRTRIAYKPRRTREGFALIPKLTDL